MHACLVGKANVSTLCWRQSNCGNRWQTSCTAALGSSDREADGRTNCQTHSCAHRSANHPHTLLRTDAPCGVTPCRAVPFPAVQCHPIRCHAVPSVLCPAQPRPAPPRPALPRPALPCPASNTAKADKWCLEPSYVPGGPTGTRLTVGDGQSRSRRWDTRNCFATPRRHSHVRYMAARTSTLVAHLSVVQACTAAAPSRGAAPQRDAHCIPADAPPVPPPVGCCANGRLCAENRN